MTPADLAEWMTTGQVARALGVSSTRVRQLSDEGRIAHLSTALGKLYDPAAVEAMACINRPSGRPPVGVTLETL